MDPGVGDGVLLARRVVHLGRVPWGHLPGVGLDLARGQLGLPDSVGVCCFD